MLFQGRAMIGPKFQDRHSATLEILLIAEVFVSQDEEIESGTLRGGNQVSVREAAPAHLLRGGDFVAEECVTHLHGHTFVEQHPHAASWCSMSCWL